MQKMKTTLYSAIAGLSMLCLSSYALASPPTACPTAEAIAKGGVDKSTKVGLFQRYYVTRNSNYGTQQKWGFIMEIPFEEATSEEDALNKASIAVVTTHGSPIPELEDDIIWYCIYKNDYKYYSVAFTVDQYKRSLKRRSKSNDLRLALPRLNN